MTIVAKGCDFSGSRPTVAALKADGIQFVVRYLAPVNSATQWKLLTKPEADTYRAAGIQVVSNFEWYSGRPGEGYAAGVADAKVALAQHAACGGPANRPIYFSVDYDTTPAVYPAIGQYFAGAGSVLSVARVGAYGEWEIVKYLMDNRLVGAADASHFFAWQTYAWSAGQYDDRCALAQDQNGVTLPGGYQVDLDSAHCPDYGQWDYSTGGDVTQLDQIQAAIGRLEVALGFNEPEGVEGWLKSSLVNIQDALAPQALSKVVSDAITTAGVTLTDAQAATVAARIQAALAASLPTYEGTISVAPKATP